MRSLYVICTSGLLATALLWLGAWRLLSRKLACLLACLSLALGGGLLLLAVLPGNSFYGPVLAKVETEQKLIALTFDDGPYTPYTEELLQVLEDEGAKVTFFLVAARAKQYPELIKREVAAGHELALHSYVHQDQLKLDAEAVRANLANGKATLERLTGQPIKYFRPPHGFKDFVVMQEAHKAGLEVVNWSLMARDWTNPGAETIAERIVSQAAPGAIVLLHDGDSPSYTAARAQTVAATREILRRLKAEGYSFVTVSELLRQGGSKE